MCIRDSVFVHDQAALPLIIYSNIATPNAVDHQIAFQAAFVLMSIVLVLFVAARFFSRTKGKKSGKPSEDDLMARFFVPIPIERDDGQ